MSHAAFAIVGGGLVGAGIGYGLAKAGHDVLLLDEGDVAFRAARGNFGNVWVQGKGLNSPTYADLSRGAALGWRAFAAELEDLSGVPLHFSQNGAFYVCLSAAELDRRADALMAAEAASRIPSGVERVDRSAIAAVIPEIGETVAGATFCPLDGMVDPLRLLRALLSGYQRLGGRVQAGARIARIDGDGRGFVLQGADGTVATADRVVLAAGLGNAALAPQLGLTAPVRPVRGQVFVTEKLRPFMSCGIHFIRQTADGGVICGESSEEAGFDEATTRPVLRDSAAKITAVLPLLRHVRVVRAWGALRVMSQDGLPVYQRSATHPGAYLASVHSGVTLLPFHAGPFAAALAGDWLAPDLAAAFSPERFHV